MSESSGRTATPERPRPANRKGGKRRGPLAWLRTRWGRLTLFIRQVIAELRKVVYPTRDQLVTYTLVVLVFVAIMIAITTVLDLAFGWLVFQIFT